MSNPTTSPQSTSLTRKVLEGFVNKLEAMQKDLIRAAAMRKSNFFDLAFHLLFMLYSLNYLVFTQTGSWFFSFGRPMTPELYLEGPLAGFLLVGGLACYGLKLMLAGFSLRLAFEWLFLGALLVKTTAAFADSGLLCLLIFFYSLIRLIQMAGTSKISYYPA